MKLVFTGWAGVEPVELGSIEYANGKVSSTGVGETMAQNILDGVDRTNETAVKTAFVKAVDRYNGSYLNATLVD